MTVFARFEQRDGGTSAASAARTADAVHVRVVGGGDAEVDDVREVFEVDTAGGNVGGDDHVDLTGTGALHYAVARGLIKPAVQGFDAPAACA